MRPQAELLLKNPLQPARLPVRVPAVADRDALNLCIPEQVCRQLDLEEVMRKEITLKDGSSRRVPYVGPVEIRFENRSGFTGALVFGDEVCLGAIPLDDLDLVATPGTRRVAVNPDSPDIATSIVKGLPSADPPLDAAISTHLSS